MGNLGRGLGSGENKLVVVLMVVEITDVIILDTSRYILTGCKLCKLGCNVSSVTSPSYKCKSYSKLIRQGWVIKTDTKQIAITFQIYYWTNITVTPTI